MALETGDTSLVDDEFYGVTHKAADARTRRVARSFVADVRSLAAAVNRDTLEEALAAKDVDRVVATLNPRGSFLEEAETALGEVFRAAGQAVTTETLSKLRTRTARMRISAPSKLVMRFDATNPRATKVAREIGAELVTDVTDTMKEAIRERVGAAFEEGIPPRELASQLIDEGLGLDTRRLSAVAKFRDELETKAAEALAEGAEIPDDVVDRIDRRVAKYYDAQLRSRAETIARQETLAAASAGQREAWDQAKDAGLIDGATAKRSLVCTPDERLCDLCEPADGQVVGLNEPFTIGSGEKVMDVPLHVQCRCAVSLELGD